MAEEGLNSMIELKAPVVEAVLMEDRARVMRRGLITLPVGRHRIQVRSVAPVLADKTVSVDCDQSDLVRVLDTRVVRRLVIRSEDESTTPELTALRTQSKNLQRDIERAEAKMERMVVRIRNLKKVSTQTLRELAADSGWGRKIKPSRAAELATLRTRIIEGSDTILSLSEELRDRDEERQRLDSQIVALQSPGETRLACIELDVECLTACDCSFTLDYVVPGACWRPYHVAQLLEEEGKVNVEFQTDACVWQNTGEDWTDVRLRFSTERVSLGVEPPELSTDYLATRRKSDAVYIESREQDVDSLAAGGTQLSAVPGIDDGGLALDIKAPQACSVPSNGKPHRVFLMKFKTSADCSLVAKPELNPCVLLATSLENAGDSPVLAGPVDLIRDSGLVGRSQVLYVASGERFDIGWGPEPELRIRRETESSSEASRVLSSWTVKKHTTRVRVSNIGQRKHSVLVTERVPVSEIDKVKIEVDSDKTTGGHNADENGFVEWTMDIAPLGQVKIDLCYAIRKHDDVQG